MMFLYWMIVGAFTPWKPLVHIDGVTLEFVDGDLGVPPTRFWNHRRLASEVWRKVVILEMHDVPRGGIYVGFRDKWGSIVVCHDPVSVPRFAMKVGHEDVGFFALDDPSAGATQLPFKSVTLSTVPEAMAQGIKIV